MLICASMISVPGGPSCHALPHHGDHIGDCSLGWTVFQCKFLLRWGTFTRLTTGGKSTCFVTVNISPFADISPRTSGFRWVESHYKPVAPSSHQLAHHVALLSASAPTAICAFSTGYLRHVVKHQPGVPPLFGMFNDFSNGVMLYRIFRLGCRDR